MTTRILIARHGNTFFPTETPRRVGGRTDLSLVEKERAHALGQYIKDHHLLPDVIWAAPLKRTMETARFACEAMKMDPSMIQKDHRFTEIDYGPDENKTEDEVMLRLGKDRLKKNSRDLSEFSEEQMKEEGRAIIDAWNRDAIVPDGWLVDPQRYIDTWLAVGKEIEEKHKDQTVMIVSSNGIIRFSPYLTGDFKAFAAEHKIKVTTGGLCIFEKESKAPHWTCTAWNIKSWV
ncbi:MAG: histidine phosphatase family protein [Pseudomonadota bacterium]|nr:histidine phosphatase family protein [Gammaproteobacteria bacterium]MBU1558915.1 histidine phosphatase family protein [Gammaproteobacteria bacterium]MBU1926239.1 histidine phosphatase family protein [Gammaproteobacteria bacterium]MBU2546251.1 histidine phosphatase family protein [Gammaproteobacteria bacterium]